MKIAVATDNGTTICKHFGRAAYYLIFTVETGQIMRKELHEKAGHQQFSNELHLDDPVTQAHGYGLGAASDHKHGQMIEPILDCEAVIVGGMGRGAHMAIEQANIHPVITELADPERAVLAYLDGTLVNHTEWLH